MSWSEVILKVLLGTSSCSDCPPERLYRSIVLWRVGARSRPQATKALPPLKKAILETGGLFFKFFLSKTAGGAAIWSRDYICLDVSLKQVSCRLLWVLTPHISQTVEKNDGFDWISRHTHMSPLCRCKSHAACYGLYAPRARDWMNRKPGARA